MNAVLRPEYSLTAQDLLVACRPDTPLFLAGPADTVLAQGIVAAVPHSGAPLNERVREALQGAKARGCPQPVVAGAVPFDVREPAALSVVHSLLRAGPLAVTHMPPSGTGVFAVHPMPSGADYAAGVARAAADIRAGRLDKVVLARTLELEGERRVDAKALLTRLAARNTHGYAFSVDAGGGCTLLGASPELLVSRRNGLVRANPLAGSAPRSSDPHEDRRRAQALMDSAKDLQEHRVVVEAVRRSLAPLCRALVVPDHPSLIHTPTMWHLSTEVSGMSEADALTLALALHPTPAVCGHPHDAARELIACSEAFDRGFYAGMLGWTDSGGDGEWIVTLRCAQVQERRVRLFAGAGIVGDSRPEAELAETTAKFRTMLDALGLAHDAAGEAA